MDNWPFPSVNGQQTDQSKAFMALCAGQSDKSQHKPVLYDLSNVEEALL